MSLIVQKFGGTSLATVENRLLVAERVKQNIESGNITVVIVSAMGRKGMPYATDSLLNLAKQAYLEISDRESDLLCSCGEVISAVALVQSLRSLKLNAVSLTGAQAGIITDKKFTNSNILKINPQKIKSIISKKKIPVIAGFQGSSEDGEITTFGRGGSDTSASIIAAAIKADLIEIYTDVKGVMTADPQIVKTAKLIKRADFSEIVEMADMGAGVVHPKAVEVAAEANIPLKIRSSFSDNNGTLITTFKPKKIITAVTSKENIVFIKIECDRSTPELDIFSKLAAKSISADFIDILQFQITFVVDLKDKEKTQQLLTEKKYIMEEDLVKISVIGAGMTGIPGVMAKVIETLRKEDIMIYQATDSHTTISCLIEKKKKNSALQALHSEFCLDSEVSK